MAVPEAALSRLRLEALGARPEGMRNDFLPRDVTAKFAWVKKTKLVLLGDVLGLW